MKFRKKTCAGVFYNEVVDLRPATLLNRDSSTGFSCEICETCKYTYSLGHLEMTASEEKSPNIFNITEKLFLAAAWGN